MNEFFATTADIHRIAGDLPADADLHPTADGRGKTIVESMARLARMVGRDREDASDDAWRALAKEFAEAQLRLLSEAAARVLSRSSLPVGAPLVAAGTGAFVLQRLAKKLGRRFEPWADLVPASAELRPAVAAAAPAVAVGLLLEAA
jgi:probable H4MPT-linked C1 transfer pathway protein